MGEGEPPTLGRGGILAGSDHRRSLYRGNSGGHGHGPAGVEAWSASGDAGPGWIGFRRVRDSLLPWIVSGYSDNFVGRLSGRGATWRGGSRVSRDPPVSGPTSALRRTAQRIGGKR